MLILNKQTKMSQHNQHNSISVLFRNALCTVFVSNNTVSLFIIKINVKVYGRQRIRI